MGIFGPPNVEKMKAKGDIKGLIQALGYHKDQTIIEAASVVLVEIGLAAVKPLIDTLQTTDKVLEQSAKETLVKIGEIGTEPLIAALDNHMICKSAAEVLVKIGEPGLSLAIEHLRNELLSTKEEVTTAAQALIGIGAPAVERLAAILTDISIKKVCKKANAMVVCRAFNMNLIPYHTDLLRHVSEVLNNGFNLRGIVAAIFGWIGDANAVEPLLSTLNDENDFVRWATAGALFTIGDNKALDPLEKHLEDEDLLIFGTGSVWVLIGDGKTIKPIITNAKNGEPDIRQKALETLNKMGWQKT